VESERSESDSYLFQKQRDMVIRKGIASIFRFKSRKVSNFFQQWKFKTQFMNYLQIQLGFELKTPNEEAKY
jgi:hypothetical protein